MAITAGDSVTFEYTGRLDDGTVFDTSKQDIAEEAGLAEMESAQEYGTLTVELGAGEIIQGLEDALLDMESGDAETVSIPPEKAYGEWTEEQIREFETEELQQMLGDETPEEGQFLQTQDGRLAQIESVGSENTRVDFNHQLAGETLEFEVEIVDVA